MLLLVLFEVSVGIAGVVIHGSDLSNIAKLAWQAFYNGQSFDHQQIEQIQNAVRARGPLSAVTQRSHHSGVLFIGVQLQCCGFSTTQDMVVQPCTFNVPCEPVIVSWLGSRLLWVAIVVMSVAGAQVRYRCLRFHVACMLLTVCIGLILDIGL